MRNRSDTMAQPPIRNMMMGAVCDGQRVVQWKHVSVTDVIRIDDVYATPDPEAAGVVDGPSTKWMDGSVYADVTLTSGAPTTEVLAAFRRGKEKKDRKRKDRKRKDRTKKEGKNTLCNHRRPPLESTRAPLEPGGDPNVGSSQQTTFV